MQAFFVASAIFSLMVFEAPAEPNLDSNIQSLGTPDSNRQFILASHPSANQLNFRQAMIDSGLGLEFQ